MKNKVLVTIFTMVLVIASITPTNVFASQRTVTTLFSGDSTVFQVGEGAYLHASVSCTSVYGGNLKACSWYAGLTGTYAFTVRERCQASFGRNGDLDSEMSKRNFVPSGSYQETDVEQLSMNKSIIVDYITATVYY